LKLHSLIYSFITRPEFCIKTHQTVLRRIQNQNSVTKNMISRTFTFAAQSSFYCFSDSSKVNSSKISIKQPRALFLNEHRSLKFGHPSRVPWLPEPKLKQSKSRSICFFNAGDKSKDGPQGKETGLDWPILERWEVPWGWQTASLTSFACGIRCHFWVLGNLFNIYITHL
ncbi:hypothetical protein PanWU01x14_173090, partial [Parasponia andersonii]